MPKPIPVLVVVMSLLALGAAGCADMRGDPGIAARELVVKARDTVESFRGSPDMGQFQRQLATARGVVVLPSVLRAGFIGGAELGSGVLLARAADGSWGYPAFYTLGSASIGLQIGVEGTRIIMVLRNEKAVAAVIRHQGKLGADLGLTVGVMGKGMEAATTANVGTDIVAFSDSIVGVYGGASLEGSVLARRNDLNAAYYGAGAMPAAIVLERRLANPDADPLRMALAPR